MTTSNVLFSMSSAQAGRELDASPSVLACLVERGALRVSVRELPYPMWSGVRFDPVAVVALREDAPEELEAARAAAPCFQLPEVARASALGVVLRATGR